MSEAETENNPPAEPDSEQASPPAKKTAAKKQPAKKEAAPGEGKAADFSKGDVDLTELKMLVKDSDSVRRLQTALGTNVTGDFDRGTMMALKSWQNKMGFEGGRGRQVNPDQAKLLFKDNYKIITPKD